jgi:UDP-N-acetylmuramate--alanine ligase
LLSVKDIKQVYFIGIGGIGMSALARYFLSLGKKVSGYDKTVTPLTTALAKEGMQIHYEENLQLVPKDAELIVYTPAVPATHKELIYFKEAGARVMKRSEVLGIISNSSFNICIGGTHGKTTTTTITAHILRHTGYGCNAFLGGIAVNYETNFWSDPRNVAVIEADEYDRSFLRLHPDIAVISSMDPDHLDIYGTEECLQQAFVDFSKCIKPGGTLFSKYGLPKSAELQAGRKFTYSLQNKAADIYAEDIVMSEGMYRFTVVMPDAKITGIELNMGGLHNVENTVVSVAIAHQLGISEEKIKAAVAAFRGVHRRFEYIVKMPGLIFVDDYAHHPQELKALISGAKALFPEKKCLVVFQPHLFSRTKDLSAGFAESLDAADEVILLPVYPARELPVEGVSSKLIADQMNLKTVQVLEKNDLLGYIKKMGIHANGDTLLITAGAGDIDQLIQPLKKILAENG